MMKCENIMMDQKPIFMELIKYFIDISFCTFFSFSWFLGFHDDHTYPNDKNKEFGKCTEVRPIFCHRYMFVYQWVSRRRGWWFDIVSGGLNVQLYNSCYISCSCRMQHLCNMWSLQKSAYVFVKTVSCSMNINTLSLFFHNCIWQSCCFLHGSQERETTI